MNTKVSDGYPGSKTRRSCIPLPPNEQLKLNAPSIEEIAKEWVLMWSYDVDDPERDRFEWVSEFEYEACYNEPETAIDLVLAVLKLDPDTETIEVLAAGPLEQVIANHGEKIIDRVERLAKSDPAFASLLGGVWKNAMSDEIWEIVQRVWDRSRWD